MEGRSKRQRTFLEKSKGLVLVALVCSATAAQAAFNSQINQFKIRAYQLFNCESLFTSSDSEGVQKVKDIISSESTVIGDDCLNQLMRKNYFETSTALIQDYFSQEPKRLAKAESSVRDAVEWVKKSQNNVLTVLEGAQLQALSKEATTVISPAFQWAQSLDHVSISVKFATRMDSPGCLDTFDPNITLTNNRFYMSINCKIDKKVLRYELDLELMEDIDTELSTYEIGSVGRLYANFTKSNRPSRWRRLLKQTEKIPNMQIWWEIHEKHDEALLKHTQFDTDEEFMENNNIINIQSPPKKKKLTKAQKKAAAKAEKEARQAAEQVSNTETVEETEPIEENQEKQEEL